MLERQVPLPRADRPAAFKLSVVVPAHDEADCVAELARRVFAAAADEQELEIVFVDDGSTDPTLARLRELAAADGRVHYVALARNFGHQNAILAGLMHASGDAVVVMDSDLQHPPEMIPELVERWRGGDDVVNTLRVDTRSVPRLKRWTSGGFYWLVNLLSEVPIAPNAADFRLLDRRVVDILLSFPERDVFWRGLVPWVGLRQSSIPYAARPRHAGRTKYSLRKMLSLAFDGLSAFSVAPLRLSVLLCLLMIVVGLIYSLHSLYRYATGQTVPGWTSLLIWISFISAGNFLVVGLLSEYLGRIYLQVKGRPRFIVTESSAGHRSREAAPPEAETGASGRRPEVRGAAAHASSGEPSDASHSGAARPSPADGSR